MIPIQELTKNERPGGMGTTVMSAEVVFGAPSANCRGVGICRIVPPKECRPCPCLYAPSKIGTLPVGGGLKLTLDKKDCPDVVRQQYFNTKLLQINEPFPIADDLLLGLGLPAGRKGKAGVYRMIETTDCYEWEFVLEE